MITKIVLKNFMSHRSTELELQQGLNIFIGRNGAGKSSVIDGFLYCLYGRHSRGDLHNIVNVSEPSRGFVQVEMVYAGNHYVIRRSFGPDGSLDAAELRKNGEAVISGERKKEGVSAYIEKMFGMDYERLKSCVVVQQGQLDQILSMKPRELKNLFDDLLGVSNEKAYENMHKVMKMFEERIKQETGHSITDLDRVELEIEENQHIIAKTSEELKELEQRIHEIVEKAAELEERLKASEEMMTRLHHSEKLFSSLLSSVINWVNSNNRELREAEKILQILEKEEAFNQFKQLYESEKAREQSLRAEIESLTKTLADESKKLESIRMLKELSADIEDFDTIKKKASELIEQLVNVFEKAVDAAAKHDWLVVDDLRKTYEEYSLYIYELLSKAHQVGQTKAFGEMIRLIEENLKKLSVTFSQKKAELEQSESNMKSYGVFEGFSVQEFEKHLGYAKQRAKEKAITTRSELEKAKDAVSRVEKVVNILRNKELTEVAEWELDALSVVGEEEKNLVHRLKQEIPLFSSFQAETVEKMQNELQNLNKEIGKLNGLRDGRKQVIAEAENRLSQLYEVRKTLVHAKMFYDLLEKVRTEIFWREGYVPRSLRTWAIRKVSDAVGKYVGMFNVMVDSVDVVDSEGEVVLRAFSRGKEVSIASLSGGEKVAVALAVRLALGDVLGAERLGFFILDEPTIHLDVENRAILGELFAALAKKVNQVIVITHDEELFGETEAVVYRFERNPGQTTEVKAVH